MRTSQILVPLVIAGLMGVTPRVSSAQNIQDVKSHLPAFTADSSGTAAVLYSYYPSLDLTVKMEARSKPNLFSTPEVAYVLGGLYANLPSLLAHWWYPNATAAQVANVAAKLQKESKDLQTPFEKPKASLVLDLGSDGITFTYTGQAPQAGGQVSFKKEVSWKEMLREEGS